jgi:hypothetical protein
MSEPIDDPRNDRHYTRAGDGPSGDVALARIQGGRIM